jgi:hypothetical protein
LRKLLVWILGPLAVAALAAGLGKRLARDPRGTFFQATAALPAIERTALESAPALAVANATWAFGSAEAVRNMIRTELDRLPDSEGLRRAQVFTRFGIIDTNFDGQAAVFSQACLADPSVCDPDRLKAAAQREVQRRFVAPGNTLPLFMTGGHPTAAGPR